MVWKHALAPLAFAAAAIAGSPDDGHDLVYLRDIDPTIIQEIRYATVNNFTGAIVPGYQASECLLRRPVAIALAKVQADLRWHGYSLKVYDCYRPRQAVLAFAAWAAHAPIGFNNRFYPAITPDRLIAEGYIASNSRHSLGIAIDLTIVAMPPTPVPAFSQTARYGSCAGPASARSPDNGLDMGTSFDCFDPRSWTSDPRITPNQQVHRRLLVAAMTRQGFHNFSREWWHFALPLPETPPLDIPITTHKPGAKMGVVKPGK